MSSEKRTEEKNPLIPTQSLDLSLNCEYLGHSPTNTAKALSTEPLVPSQTNREWHVHGIDPKQQNRGLENETD